MGSSMLERLKEWAGRVKLDIFALYLAARDPRVPWYAKVLAALIAAYALSPIDPIPDFIPVLGYLDELIVLPLGIVVVVRLIPHEVMNDLRQKAGSRFTHEPRSIVGAVGVIVMWLVAGAFLIWLICTR